MNRTMTVSILLLLLLGCTSETRNGAQPLQPDPPPPEADPDKVRENIRKLGEDLPRAAHEVHIGELIRAGRHAEPYLFEALESENPRTRANAIFVLRYSNNPRTVAKIAPLLKDPVKEVALEAAAVLADKGRKDGIPILISGLRHEKLGVRKLCIRVLQNATKVYFGFHPTDPKDRREFSVKKWEAWWREKGATMRLASSGR
jgi:hypothetical protein